MKARLKTVLKVLFIISFCILFFIQLLDTHKKVKSWYNINRARDLLRTLSWIRDHSEPDDVILTTWILGCQVVTYADRRVLATSKVYPSQIKALAERYRDISTFFFSQTEEDAMEIIHKYNIKYIFLPRRFNYWICRYIGACNLTVNKRVLTDTGRSFTMIGRMLDKKRFKNFTLDYKSKYYLVYKFLGDA